MWGRWKRSRTRRRGRSLREPRRFLRAAAGTGGFLIARRAGSRFPSNSARSLVRRPGARKDRAGFRRGWGTPEGAVDQAAIAAPAKAASARSSPSARPAPGEGEHDVLGHAPPRGLPQIGDGEEADARRGDPPRERHPALARRHADGGVGAHAAANGDAVLAASVGFEREGDRSSAVPSSASQAEGPVLLRREDARDTGNRCVAANAGASGDRAVPLDDIARFRLREKRHPALRR